MRRDMAAWMLAGASLFAAAPVEAENWFSRGCHSFCQGYLENHLWPAQYVEADRAQTRAPFCVMIDKGWQLQSTLADYHFDPESQRLTEAGIVKIRTILREHPEDRRVVFVLEALTAEDTAQRLAAAQEVAGRLAPAGTPPVVVTTNTQPRGLPADYIDTVNRRFQATTPDPRLPSADGSSSSSGGAAGMGGGM